MTRKADFEQSSQESEYWFPYHYLSRMPDIGFSQHLVDSWGVNYISTIDFVLKQIARCNPRSIIDIGCGDGRLTREIHKKFPHIDLKGVDYSSRAIALANVMNQDLVDLRYEQVDITNVSFPEKYQVAILMEVLEHIPLDECDLFVSGVRSVLEGGGNLLLTVPHSNKPVEYKHFQHFTIESTTNLLAPYFNIVEAIPFERKGLARRVLDIALCNRFFVMNNRRMLNFLYKMHDKYLFHCSNEKECQRIFVRAVAK